MKNTIRLSKKLLRFCNAAFTGKKIPKLKKKTYHVEKQFIQLFTD